MSFEGIAVRRLMYTLGICAVLSGTASARDIIGRGGGLGVSAVMEQTNGWRQALVHVVSAPSFCSNTNVAIVDSTDGRRFTQGPFRGDLTTDLAGNPICSTLIHLSSSTGLPGRWTASGLIDGHPWTVTGEMQACLINATQMHAAEHTSFGDFFYSIDDGQINQAIGLGYEHRGSTFSVETAENFSTKPFRRFFIGAPQIEHFYTINDGDAISVINFGYAEERREGFIYAVQKPNTVPLTRWSHFDAANSDLKHFYSAHGEQPPGPGWQHEGVVGYACN